MIIQTVVSFFRPPLEPKGDKNVVTVVPDTAVSRPDIKSISAAGEHPFVRPVSEPATSQPQTTTPPQKSTGFNTDFKTIQEREKGRRATIENMRKTIRSGSMDTNTIMQQEKKLQKIEDSGDSFM